MNDHQLQIIELSKHPLNYGQLKDADIVKIGKNLSCGDQVSVYIKVKGDAGSVKRSDRSPKSEVRSPKSELPITNYQLQIAQITFEATGCSVSIASASLLSDYLVGKSLEEVLKIGTKEIEELIGIPLGPSRLKCAWLPLDAIQQGVKELGDRD